VSDGAAAVIVCNRSALKRLNIDASRAIRVLAAVVQSGSARSEEDVANHCTALAARRAYELAGVGPDDISVAEVHDATAMGEIIQTEVFGLVPPGEAGAGAGRGETALGGRVPVNTSGGLVSKGHPLGATGLGQIHELVTQLRGDAGGRQVDGARFAIAENSGGFYGVEDGMSAVTILAAI